MITKTHVTQVLLIIKQRNFDVTFTHGSYVLQMLLVLSSIHAQQDQSQRVFIPPRIKQEMEKVKCKYVKTVCQCFTCFSVNQVVVVLKSPVSGLALSSLKVQSFNPII